MQLILLFDLVRPVVDLVQLAPYHVSPAPPVLSALFVTSPADAARLIMACREAADGGRICAATITFAASRPELHAPMFSECRLFGPVTGGEGPSISLPGFTSWACWMLGGGMADPAWPGWCMLLRLLRSRGVCCRGSSGGRAFVSALSRDAPFQLPGAFCSSGGSCSGSLGGRARDSGGVGVRLSADGGR